MSEIHEIPKDLSPSKSLVVNLRQQLMQVLPFSEMQAEHIDQFIKAAKESYFEPDEVILDPNHGPISRLYFVRQGTVVARKGIAQEAGAAHAIETGEFFPVSAAMAGRAVTATYSAQGDCFCLTISRDAMLQLAEQSGPFADFLNQRILKFLEQSRKILQRHYASQVFAEQSLETPLGALPRKKPLFVQEHTSIQEALKQMHERRVGSILVTNSQKDLVGILTRYDILGRVTMPAVSLERPISDVMTRGVKALTVMDTAQDAALMMSKYGIRHVPVMDGQEIVNIVSERDLFAAQRLSLKNISSAIRTAEDVATLITCAKDIRNFAKNLLGQGVQARQLTALISHLNDLICERLVLIHANQHQLDLKAFAWLALGSEGRGEQTIATDQDNALVFLSAHPDAERNKYLSFAKEVNLALDACGYPLCKGQVMASNPKICLSDTEWLERFSHWIEHGSPEDLLNASIYFDFRVVAGNADLVTPMRDLVTRQAQAIPRFIKLLADNSLRMRVPISWHGGIDTQKVAGKECIDLKMQGTAIVVDAARIYSLAKGITVTSTRERLLQVGRALEVPEREYEAWVSAFEFLQMLRLSIQIEGASIADNPNMMEYASLNDIDRRILKESIKTIRTLQQRLELDYGR